MEAQKLITLNDQDKYYLVDQTIQNNIKYFLANKLVNEEISNQTIILKEKKVGEDFYLEEETDKKTLKFLSTIFISKLINEIDEI